MFFVNFDIILTSGGGGGGGTPRPNPTNTPRAGRRREDGSRPPVWPKWIGTESDI